MRDAKELVELYNLINKSDFRHKLWEISFSESEIGFKTRHTLCGTYLSGKILFDSNHYIVYNYVGYDDVTVPLSKVEYGINVRDEIGNEISKLETSIMLAPSVDWVEIFKNELLNIFKDFDVDRTENLVVHLIGVDFIVKFNENTNAFSVEVVQTTHPDNSKVLLLGVVCDNNYNNVLSAIRKEFKNAKSRFYHLESISNMIIWGK